MGRQHVLYILGRDLLLGHHAPGQIVGARRKVGVGAVPYEGVGIEIPCAGGVVNVVGVVVAAEGIPRVQRTVLGQVEVILFDKVTQISRAHEVLLLAQGVVQVQCVQAQLVRHDDIDIVGYAAGHPVVAADGLQPPNLVHILEGNAVHLIGAVLFQQAAQAAGTLAGGAHVGQHKVDDIFLADAALDQRVSAQHARVGGDGLGRGHADVGSVHTAGRPQALALHGVGHGSHPQAVAGQGDLDARNHGFVDSRVVLRLEHGKFFRGKMAGAGIVVAGDHRGAVIRRIFADQNGSASHV